MDTIGSAPREGRTEHVQIREVGTVGGNAGPAAGYSAPEHDDAPARRLSRPFLPAWLLTGALLAVGVLWLGGAFETIMWSDSYAMSSSAGNSGAENPPWVVMLRNLGQSASLLLVVGLMSASALLVVQGALRSREPRAAVDR